MKMTENTKRCLNAIARAEAAWVNIGNDKLGRERVTPVIPYPEVEEKKATIIEITPKEVIEKRMEERNKDIPKVEEPKEEVKETKEVKEETTTEKKPRTVLPKEVKEAIDKKIQEKLEATEKKEENPLDKFTEEEKKLVLEKAQTIKLVKEELAELKEGKALIENYDNLTSSAKKKAIKSLITTTIASFKEARVDEVLDIGSKTAKIASDSCKKYYGGMIASVVKELKLMKENSLAQSIAKVLEEEQKQDILRNKSEFVKLSEKVEAKATTTAQIVTFLNAVDFILKTINNGHNVEFALSRPECKDLLVAANEIGLFDKDEDETSADENKESTNPADMEGMTVEEALKAFDEGNVDEEENVDGTIVDTEEVEEEEAVPVNTQNIGQLYDDMTEVMKEFLTQQQ